MAIGGELLQEHLTDRNMALDAILFSPRCCCCPMVGIAHVDVGEDAELHIRDKLFCVLTQAQVDSRLN